MGKEMWTRRRFVRGLAAGGVVTSLAPWDALAWTRSSRQEGAVLRGTEFDLTIRETPMNITGAPRIARTINGRLPGPLLRLREGDTVTLRVRNELDEDASIHWHGLILPANMDGVPGLSYHGIHPGQTFVYTFRLKQHGTYWYHSHSGFQEQRGVYAPLVIEPLKPDGITSDREHVVMLSDWTDESPERVFGKLKKESDYYNFRQRTLGDFIGDVRAHGWKATVAERKAWGEMRMSASDLADVTGATYTYLMNGHAPAANWTGLFTPGEKLRLRFINGSAMTYFDVRIPGLKLTVVAADGQAVRPVTVDELRIAVAETYDVIVEPAGADAFTIFAQAMDRTGFAAGTLAARDGLRAPVPEVDPRPVLSMSDMGHGHVGTDHTGHMAGSGVTSAPPATGADGADAKGGAGAPEPDPHAGHTIAGTAAPLAPAAPSLQAAGAPGVTHSLTEGNPLVDMQTMSPTSKLEDPGIGLRGNGRRVLTYSDLRSTFDDPDGREPSRTIELHLTGHMQRFAWSFDGVKFSSAEPLRLTYGERLRIVLVNDTMMTHPIHLHGMWSDLEDDDGKFLVRKHTIDMPPGSRRSYRVTADALGRWAYHCHLLYHMEAGMMREVRVEEPTS
jgi:CopA family copper-resistance protein